MGIGTSGERLYKNREARAVNSVRRFLTHPLLDEACRAAGHQFRRRCWTPLLTTLACVWMEMNGASVRQAEDYVHSLWPDDDSHRLRDGSSLCAARQRLPLLVFEFIFRKLGLNAAEKLNFRFRGLPVYVLDGTTLRTPASEANCEAFGHSSNQSGRSRRPLVRMVLLICIGCGAALDAAYGGYAVSEWALFLELLPRVPQGGLILADRGFGTFLMCSECRRHRLHVLTRVNKLRRSTPLKSLGDGDEIHRWSRPRGHVSRPDLLALGPETLDLRIVTRMLRRQGYRDVVLSVATTLLDPLEYPADELIELYLQRWNIELDLRTLKTHYGMAQLSGESKDVVLKEICATLIASNCVVAAQVESGGNPRKLSHTRARELLVTCAAQMVCATPECMVRLYKAMLAAIATAMLEERKRLPQPRAIVQRMSTYPVLTTSREEWRRAHHVA